jgi:TetR/AcrR family transcriptional repressor of nem operon
MNEQPTKVRIIEAAEELMLEKSFHSVGLNEILKAVKVPKGSFYHYFDSKEQFGVEMLKHYVADASAYKRRLFLSSDTESNPRRRLLTYLESSIAKFLEYEGKCPCLVVKLASEVASFSESMREVLAEGHKESASITEALIREGIENGAIQGRRDPVFTASVIEALWTGAMQHAMLSRNAEALRNAQQFIADDLIPEV